MEPIELRITEEPSKGGKDGKDTIFYLREHPYIPGMSIQATALTREGAEWLASRISNAVLRK